MKVLLFQNEITKVWYLFIIELFIIKHVIIKHIDDRIFGIDKHNILEVTEILLVAGDRRSGIQATDAFAPLKIWKY